MNSESSTEIQKIEQNFNLQIKNFDVALLGAAISNGQGEFDSLKLFALLFQTIPNSYLEKNLEVSEAIIWFKDKYGADIQADWHRKRRLESGGQMTIDDNIFVLYDDLLVYFDTGQSSIQLHYNATPIRMVYRLAEQILKFKKFKKRGESRIHFLQTGFSGLKTDSMVLEPIELDLEMNYNDDLEPVHQHILENIANQNTSGIFLFYGQPGTGKTTYLRHLITQTEKPVLYLSSRSAADLENPGMMSIWKDLPNSICVIEDAELILTDRGENAASPVASILNLTDGFLAQCFHIQFICTFNTPLSAIDSALTRKGRLIASYEFKALQKEKAQQLSDSLGYKTKMEKDMTLAEIYNQEKNRFETGKGKQRIGFF